MLRSKEIHRNISSLEETGKMISASDDVNVNGEGLSSLMKPKMDAGLVDDSDEASLFTQLDCKCILEDKTVSEVARPNDSDNNFSDRDCGEPFVSQRITIDFTPIEGIDDDEVLEKKCEYLWKIINSQPLFDYTNYMQEEEAVDNDKVIGEDKEKNEIESQSGTSVAVHTPTLGIEWLKKGVGQPVMFAAKQASRYCKLESSNYLNETKKKNTPTKNITKDLEDTRLNSARSQKQPKQTTGDGNVRRSRNTAAICVELEEWDERHPKQVQNLYSHYLSFKY